VNLYFDDIDIFGSDTTIEQLSKHDACVKSQKKKNGYANFYNLGLSLGGFIGIKIPEGKLAIIFAKDRVTFYEAFLTV
jgi:hypothetical protein